MGTVPFAYVSTPKGRTAVGKKLPDYFGKDKNSVQLPSSTATRRLIITNANAEVDAVRRQAAAIESAASHPSSATRSRARSERPSRSQEAPWIYVNYIVPNTKKPPFDDVRVRQALTLAIDRYAGSASLQKITDREGRRRTHAAEGPVRAG